MYRQPHQKSFLMLLCCLFLFLAACGQGASTTQPPFATQAPPTSIPLRPTLTSCPRPGTARAAVMTPLVLGTHKNIVYIINHYSGTTPIGQLVRYDVTTGSTRTILKLNNEEIKDATLSADGQWVIFVTDVTNDTGLQLIGWTTM